MPLAGSVAETHPRPATHTPLQLSSVPKVGQEWQFVAPVAARARCPGRGAESPLLQQSLAQPAPSRRNAAESPLRVCPEEATVRPGTAGGSPPRSIHTLGLCVIPVQFTILKAIMARMASWEKGYNTSLEHRQALLCLFKFFRPE